ncbi:MAG: CPBP family intramembrane metalloprotease [Bacteroidales bacterium]|nr:CPBP family intramembrane metalloprotease [Bacteroidales bacterium]
MKHLESALSNNKEWFSYFLMLVIIPVVAQIPVALPYLIIRGVTSLPDGGDESLSIIMNPANYGIDSTIGLGLIILPFIFMLVAFMVVFRPLHGRSFKTVINGTTVIRWRRILIGFAVCFVVLLFFLVVDYYLNIKKYEMRLNWKALIPLAVVSFVLIPFQAFYEEIVFRGYIAQGIGRLTGNRFLVVIIPTLLFALLHSFNPEVTRYGFWQMMPFYFIGGLSYALISVLDDGIELAMGMHAANNVFSSIFVTMEGSVFKTEALLYMKEIDISTEYVPFILTELIVFGAIAYKYRWRFKTLVTKIEGKDTGVSLVQV